MGISDQTLAGFRERGREELPGQHRSEDQDWIRDTIGGQLSDPAKYNGKNKHCQKGTDYCPSNADRSLLVADVNVSPGEDVEKLAVAPKVTPIILFGAAGFDQELLHTIVNCGMRNANCRV